MLLTNTPSIQKVQVDALRLAADHPRRHPARELQKLRKVIARYGEQISPVLVSPDGEILYGEAFWLALRADGASEVDLIVVAGKTPSELNALRLALNRIPMDAAWDRKNVQKLLNNLVELEFDLD